MMPVLFSDGRTSTGGGGAGGGVVMALGMRSAKSWGIWGKEVVMTLFTVREYWAE